MLILLFNIQLSKFLINSLLVSLTYFLRCFILKTTRIFFISNCLSNSHIYFSRRSITFLFTFYQFVSIDFFRLKIYRVSIMLSSQLPAQFFDFVFFLIRSYLFSLSYIYSLLLLIKIYLRRYFVFVVFVRIIFCEIIFDFTIFFVYLKFHDFFCIRCSNY